MAEKSIYFDNAATTPLRKEVFEAMVPYLQQNYGNPSSIYDLAKVSSNAISRAREQVASLLGCTSGEVIFTSGGTESDNWVLRSAARLKAHPHIITTAIEHHAVLHTLYDLEKQGVRVSYVDVNPEGIVDARAIEKEICEDTVLISVMFANNEIGTLQPIEEIGRLSRERGVLFHTDAVQAVGHVPIDVEAMHIDLLSLSAHKFNGPKGVGALYMRRGVRLPAFLTGGAQENNLRAGTENVAGIVGLGKAAEIAKEEMVASALSLTTLRDYLIAHVLAKIDHAWLNGHPTKRLPGNVNFGFSFIEGESMLLMLGMHGICASSGSACTSGSLDPSHVLLALGLKHEQAHGSLRITLGYQNTKSEVDTLIEVLPPIVARLRDMSPLYDEYLRTKRGK